MATWKADRLYHGADYNPDQWLDYPEILEQDIEYMKKAHFNCVSLGIFAWAHLEPTEGEYKFDRMRQIIDKLYENGIYTILATPSGAKPVWMSEKYPEICRVNVFGQRELAGHRHNHCFTSPVYREKTAQMNKRLAQEFGNHPAVILWHLSNEYSGECYCPLCAGAFRGWLRNKYETLDKLNHEWWAHFWSHTYTSWEQINPPFSFGENGIHGLNLDWKRFVTDQTVDFIRAETAAVREGGSQLPVTANLMGFYSGGLNYCKLGDVLDVVSWDSYPSWHNDDADILDIPAGTAASHDLMRGIKRQPFLLMESTPSTTNWMGVSKLKKPFMHKLSSMQAIAHGSDSVQYFQWRKSRGSTEKFHGAVVDHDCSCEHRVFRDVADVGKMLESVKKLTGSVIKADVAIIFDWENKWALEDAKGPRNIGMNYQQAIHEHYRSFWEMGISVDIIDMEMAGKPDLSRYKLVIAPMLYLYRAGITGILKSFVENGGVLVGTYWSGVVNENDLCYLGGRPGEGMTDVFGICADEIDALHDSQSNFMIYRDKKYKLTELCELIRLTGTDDGKRAEVIAKYGDDFYAGKPALTVNRYGQGRAYYIAAKPERAFLRSFYGRLAKKLDLRPDIIGKLPYGVTLSRRYADDGTVFYFFQNYTENSAIIRLTKPLKYTGSDKSVKRLVLRGYGVAVLEGLN